jgi:hypothetical protein
MMPKGNLKLKDGEAKRASCILRSLVKFEDNKFFELHHHFLSCANSLESSFTPNRRLKCDKQKHHESQTNGVLKKMPLGKLPPRCVLHVLNA